MVFAERALVADKQSLRGGQTGESIRAVSDAIGNAGGGRTRTYGRDTLGQRLLYPQHDVIPRIYDTVAVNVIHDTVLINIDKHHPALLPTALIRGDASWRCSGRGDAGRRCGCVAFAHGYEVVSLDSFRPGGHKSGQQASGGPEMRQFRICV